MEQAEALRMEHITKVYPNGVVANRQIDLSVRRGEIHALSGENGAGKSTLMKILFGEEQPTDGQIYVGGNPVRITSPSVAIKLGIGMVHQHFMLVPSLTVMENMILGIEPTRGIFIDRRTAEARVREISQKFNLDVPPNKRISELSVGQMQKVEILKALFHGAQILILDEPTAVLTPQETHELFAELKTLKAEGYTVIFISHKLKEVKELCDRITIIRSGCTMGVYDIGSISEYEISNIMVGHDVELKIEKSPAVPGEAAAEIRNLTVNSDDGDRQLRDLSLVLKRGEIFGIAGIEGNGQQALVDALTGENNYQAGTVKVFGKDIKGLQPDRIRGLQIGHIPADRMTSGIAPRLSIAENLSADKVGRRSLKHGLVSKAGVLRKSAIKTYAADMVEKYNIVCASPEVPISSLSGGNIQKTVLARELSSNPELIVANQPTRGVDVGATEMIRKELVAMRDAGKSVLLVSSDLGELLSLSDRLAVFLDGEIVGYFSNVAALTEEELGKYMLGLERQTAERVGEAAHA